MDELERKAYDVIGWVENGCGDIMVYENDLYFYEEPLRSEFKKIFDRKDIDAMVKRECCADILFSDPGFVLDMAGDKIHDEAGGDNDAMILIALEIIKLRGERSTFGKAMTTFIERHQK